MSLTAPGFEQVFGFDPKDTATSAPAELNGGRPIVSPGAQRVDSVARKQLSPPDQEKRKDPPPLSVSAPPPASQVSGIANGHVPIRSASEDFPKNLTLREIADSEGKSLYEMFPELKAHRRETVW